METAIQNNTYVSERAFSATQAKPEVKEHSHGHSIAYFVWVFVAIFSTIMVAVMIEEKFFIP
jgi:hypothetical protein